MAKKALPSPEVLRQLLRYEPETGKLFYKERDRHHFAPNRFGTSAFVTWHKKYAGAEASRVNKDGYAIVAVKGTAFKAHRVAWAIQYGRWPLAIDHVNGNRSDNRIENLREVTTAENNRNISIKSNNKSGVTGVVRFRGTHWYAFINHNYKRIHLGSFRDFDAAVKARKEAELRYGYHPNHGRSR